MFSDQKFNYIAPLNRTGYGIAGFGYAKGFLLNNCDFNYVVIGANDVHDPEFSRDSMVDQVRSKIALKADPNLPSIVFWHAHNLDRIDVPNREQSRALTTFELNELTDKEADNLNRFAKAYTASTHTAVIANKRCSSITSVVPHAFYNEYSSPSYSYEFETNPVQFWSDFIGIKLPQDTVIMSSVGKIEKRKGFYKLLEMPNNGLEKDILVVAFWYNPFIPGGITYSELHQRGFEQVKVPSELKVFKNKKLTVVLMPNQPTRADVYKYLVKTHGYISTSLAEGFNLPLMEAAALGLRTYVTNSFLYHPEMITGAVINGLNGVVFSTTGTNASSSKYYVEPAYDGKFFNGTGTWNNYEDSCITQFFNKHYFDIMVDGWRKAQYDNLSQLKTTFRLLFNWKDASKELLI